MSKFKMLLRLEMYGKTGADRWFLFILFRAAVCADAFAEGPVLAVDVADKGDPGPVRTAAVRDRLVDVARDDLPEEHIVQAERLYLYELAFEIYGALGHERRRY